ncbi:hypothetical protein ACHAWF_000640 [Thalassiosira exigua]
MLGRALDIWTAEEMRGIWVKTPTSQAHLIAPTARIGFDFQHAEPGYCVLAKASGGNWGACHTPSHRENACRPGAYGSYCKVQALEDSHWLDRPRRGYCPCGFGGLQEETGLEYVLTILYALSVARGSILVVLTCSSCASAAFHQSTTLLLKVTNECEDELLPQEEEILMAD